MRLVTITIKKGYPMIRYLGYACINENLKPRTFKSCRLASIEKNGLNYLIDKIKENLDFLYDILLWNEANGIKFYRVSSALMPLVTHEKLLLEHEWRWYKDKDILSKLDLIKAYVIKYNHRISMHPDQFTVINSLKPSVVKSSIEYLDYHHKLLEHIGGQDIILHVGGVYNDKAESMKRFIKVFNGLNSEMKGYIRIENDDKSYTIHDVLRLQKETQCSVVFDIHHHNCHHEKELSHGDVKKIVDSWQGKIPKVHISSGKTGFLDRSHHDFVNQDDFSVLKEWFSDYTIDVMVEAKKKEKAALKLMGEEDETL